MTAVAILGADGRMGHSLKEAIAGSHDLSLVGTWSSANEPIAAAIADADVAIDFTDDGAIETIAGALKQHPLPLVSGTTGLSVQSQAALETLSRTMPVLSDGNMSIGIHVLEALAAKAAAILPDYDIEILETHHNEKRDAPSGTALKLGHAAAAAREQTLAKAGEYPRHGSGRRTPGSIGFAVRRGGNVVGDHSVDLFGAADRLTLKHHAQTRALFADGALRAARWLIAQPNGLYAIRDMLGEI